MITLVIAGAEVRKQDDGSYHVLHPSNDAILAYCGSLVEAQDVVASLDELAWELRNDYARSRP